MQRIYLDNNATTAPDPAVLANLVSCLAKNHANPASQHSDGQQANHLLEAAREDIAERLGASYVLFTSGATEANNMVLRGLLLSSGGHLLVSAIEHPSITETARHLSKRGVEVDWVPVDSNGVVDVQYIADRLRDDTRLVALMAGNHETGVLQPISEVASLCRARNIPVHTDAAQVIGRAPFHLDSAGVTTMAVAAHKFHGVCGTGALLMSEDANLPALLWGGPQQRQLRAGTESACMAGAMNTAVELACDQLSDTQTLLQGMRDDLERLVLKQNPDVDVIGRQSPRLPQTSCLSFPGLDRQALVMALDLAGISCSTGSACASGSSDPSPVLSAMKLEEGQIQGAVRFSFSRLNKPAEVPLAAERISRVINSLRCHKDA